MVPKILTHQLGQNSSLICKVNMLKCVICSSIQKAMAKIVRTLCWNCAHNKQDKKQVQILRVWTINNNEPTSAYLYLQIRTE